MPRIALIDNFDSFTYNLQHYLLSLGVECEVIRIDRVDIDAMRLSRPAGIVLSPGPGRPSDRPILADIIKVFAEICPVLGICLGHQAIGEVYGLELAKAKKPMHGKQDYIYHQNHSMFQGILSPMPIMRYHSLVLQGDSSKLTITAKSDQGEIMALCHRSKPIWSYQFHPESILTPQGLILLKNWLMFFGIIEESLVLKAH